LCHRRMQLKGKSAVPMKIGYDRAGPRLARDKRPRRTRGLRTGSNGRSGQGFSCRERRKPGSAGSRTGAIGVGSFLAGPALEHLSYHPHHKGKLRLSRFCQTGKSRTRRREPALALARWQAFAECGNLPGGDVRYRPPGGKIGGLLVERGFARPEDIATALLEQEKGDRRRLHASTRGRAMSAAAR